MELKIGLAKELLSRALPKQKVRVLMDFLKYYVRFADHENNIIFEEELHKITGRTITMGIEELLLDRAKYEGRIEGILEGTMQGKLEGQRAIALEMKLDNFPIAQIAKLTKLSPSEIAKL